MQFQDHKEGCAHAQRMNDLFHMNYNPVFKFKARPSVFVILRPEVKKKKRITKHCSKLRLRNFMQIFC